MLQLQPPKVGGSDSLFWQLPTNGMQEKFAGQVTRLKQGSSTHLPAMQPCWPRQVMPVQAGSLSQAPVAELQNWPARQAVGQAEGTQAPERSQIVPVAQAPGQGVVQTPGAVPSLK